MRLSGDEWASFKSQTPNGKLPILFIDDAVVAQSNAILLYAGDLAGLTPKDPLQDFKVKEALVTFNEVATTWYSIWGESDAEKKTALGASIAAGTPLKDWLGRLEAQLTQSKTGFYTGSESVTVADFKVRSIRGKHTWA